VDGCVVGWLCGCFVWLFSWLVGCFVWMFGWLVVWMVVRMFVCFVLLFVDVVDVTFKVWCFNPSHFVFFSVALSVTYSLCPLGRHLDRRLHWKTIERVHIHGPSVLPKIETHGVGQNAWTTPRTESTIDAATDGGKSEGRGFAFGGNGTRLLDWVRGFLVAVGTLDVFQ